MNKKLKICFVCNDLNPGTGWGRLALNLAESIKQSGHSIGFITESGVPEKNRLVLPMRFGKNNMFSIPFGILKMRRFLHDFEVVVSFDANPHGIFTYLASLGLPIVSIIYAIGSYSLWSKSKFKNKLIRRAYESSDEVFILSEFVKKQIETGGFRFKKFSIIPAGVDTEFFKPDLNVFKSTRSNFILSVGALKPRKGYLLSIQAFKILSDKYSDLRYIIIGNPDVGGYAESLYRLVAELKLSQKVVFMKNVSDEEILNHYRQSRLFMLTPITTPAALEGFGMVYLEAGACARAVLGTLNSGAEAAVVNRVTGLLVEAQPAAVAKGAMEILDNENLADDMGKNGLAHSQEFNWPRISNIHLDNYYRILKNKFGANYL